MRSLWKLKYVKPVFYKTKKKTFLLPKRDSIVVATWIGKTISIHNGNSYKKIIVERKHLGYKLGEFSFSRKYTKKSPKLNAKKTLKKV
jgi:ribosomal protein S19